MTKKVDCKISFNNSNSSYNAGEEVFGNIDVDIYKEIAVKKLVLQIRGLAVSEWGNGFMRKTSGAKSLMFQEINLLSHKTVPELQRGTHQFDFNFTLPQKIPSSTVKNGTGLFYEIKYEAVVFLVRPFDADLKFEKEFKVISGFDLNLHPEYQIPVILENNDLIATIPRKGFVVGEKIPVNVELKNINIRSQEIIMCELYREVTHKFSKFFVNRSKISRKKLCEITKNIPPGQRACDILIKIPLEKVLPSTVDPLMKIINVQYKLSILKPETFSMSEPSLNFPIIIGAVPVKTDLSENP